MRLETIEQINVWMDSVGTLSEALMDELGLTHFGYSARAVFSVVVDSDGRALNEPVKAVFDFVGVQELTLHGALTARMLDRPDEIGWGLSEVALVRVTPDGEGVRFEALWEDDRKVEIRCHTTSVTVPGS